MGRGGEGRGKVGGVWDVLKTVRRLEIFTGVGGGGGGVMNAGASEIGEGWVGGEGRGGGKMGEFGMFSKQCVG